jgi:putative transposase
MFITTNCRRRTPVFADPACARIAVETLYSIQSFYAFFLYGFVIMPDHCHFLIQIPDGGSVSKTIGVYKRAVTFNIGRGPIWQPRFHMEIINDCSTVLTYIHMNPVAGGLCTEAEDYSWSSACGKWDVEPIVFW